MGKMVGGLRISGIFCALEEMESVLACAEKIVGAVASEIAEDRGEKEAGIVSEETFGSETAVRNTADEDIGGGEEDLELAVGIEVPKDQRIDEIGTGGRRDLRVEHFGEGGRSGARSEFELGGVNAVEGI